MQHRCSRLKFREYIAKKGVFSYFRKKELDPDKKEERGAKSLRYYAKRYLSEFRDQKRRLAMVLFLGVAGTLLEMTVPWTSKVMIDYVFPKKDVRLICLIGAALIAVMLLRFALMIYRDAQSSMLTGRFVLGLKRRLAEKILSLPLVDLQKLKTGGAVTRLQDDSDGAGQLIFTGLLTPFNSIVMFIFAFSSLVMVNWMMSLVTLFFCAAMSALAYLAFYVMRPLSKEICEDRSTISAGLTESFGGIQVVRSFRRERAVKANFGAQSDLWWRKGHYGFVAGAFVGRTFWSIFFGMELVVWIVGGIFFVKGLLTLGSLVALVSFLHWIFHPVIMIIGSFAETQKNLACAERSIDLLTCPRASLTAPPP